MNGVSMPGTPSPGAPAPLRWSAFTVGDNLAGVDRRPERFREILGYVAEAEHLGFWGFFFAEHHFHPHGEVPDPWLMVAAAAERTRGGKIRLGPMVSNLAIREPVQVAEQALLANRLSQDRVEIGIGSGNVLREHLAFGLGPDPLARKREAFARAAPRFLAALSGGTVRAEGLPTGAVTIPIAPLSAAPSKVWVAVGQAEAAVRYARDGHPVALGPPFATMTDLTELAAQVAAIRTGLGAGARPRIAAAFPIYVGPHPDEAMMALERFLEIKSDDGVGHLPTGTPPIRPARTARELLRGDLALIGTPPEAARQIARVAGTGITDLFAIPDFGGLDPIAVVPSMEAIARIAGLAGASKRQRRPDFPGVAEAHRAPFRAPISSAVAVQTSGSRRAESGPK